MIFELMRMPFAMQLFESLLSGHEYHHDSDEAVTSVNPHYFEINLAIGAISANCTKSSFATTLVRTLNHETSIFPTLRILYTVTMFFCSHCALCLLLFAPL